MAKLKLHEDKKAATLQLQNVRLSYPYLDAPRPKKKGEEDRPDKWEASFIVDSTMGSPFKENLADLKKAIAFVREKAFNGRKVVAMVHSNKKKDNEPGYEDEKGYFLCAPSYKTKPLILDNNKTERSEAPESMFYAGARVHAVIRVYAQHSKGEGMPNRVACSLEAIQFVDHDKRIDGRKQIDPDEWFGVEEIKNSSDEGGDGDWENEGSEEEEEEEDFTL